MELCRFASGMPGLVESHSGNRRDEFIVIGERNEQWRRIRGHGRRCAITSVDGSGKIRPALGVVLHDRTHYHSATRREACDSDAVGTHAPFGGVLTDETYGLPAILFRPRPSLLDRFGTNRRSLH